LRKTSHLGVSGISVKYITEEFTGHGDPCNDQSVDVVRVDNKGTGGSLGSEARHAVKIDEEGQKDFVCCGTILEDP
jgi:hypothetical protein